MQFIKSLANPNVKNLQPYQPGKPIEELERESGIKKIIKLASNENPLGPSPLALEAIKIAMLDIKLDIKRYPDGNGFILKDKLSKKLNVNCNQITLGNGSDEIFTLLLRAFATLNDEIIISQYGFAAYAIAARAMGIKIKEIPAINWKHDLDATLASITPNTKIIFIANPNNPTGNWNTKDQLINFLNNLPDRVIVLIDQAYLEYMDHENYPDYPDAMQWLDKFPNLIVTGTFSKIYGLAGLRVGYGVSSTLISDMLNRVRLPFNTNSVALMAASAALDDVAHLDKVRIINREGLLLWQQALDKLGLKYINAACNFITVDVKADANKIYSDLLKLGIIIRPLTPYNMPTYCRISIGLKSENECAIIALQKIMQNYI